MYVNGNQSSERGTCLLWKLSPHQHHNIFQLINKAQDRINGQWRRNKAPSTVYTIPVFNTLVRCVIIWEGAVTSVWPQHRRRTTANILEPHTCKLSLDLLLLKVQNAIPAWWVYCGTPSGHEGRQRWLRGPLVSSTLDWRISQPKGVVRMDNSERWTMQRSCWIIHAPVLAMKLPSLFWGPLHTPETNNSKHAQMYLAYNLNYSSTTLSKQQLQIRPTRCKNKRIHRVKLYQSRSSTITIRFVL